VSDVVEVLRLTSYYVIRLSMWFALAIFISAMVDLLYLDVVAKRALRRNKGWVGVVSAASVGAFSPFCSFIVIPLVRKLLRGGVPLSAVMAFWVASPTMDPEIYALTAAQLGISLATARLVGAIVLSFGAGFLVLFMERRGMFRDVLRDAEDDRLKMSTVAAEQSAPQPALVAATVGASGAPVASQPLAGRSPASDAPIADPATRPAAATGRDTTGDDAADCSATDCNATECNAAEDEMAEDEMDVAWWPTAKASLRSRRNWRVTFRNMGRDIVSLGKWLVLACVIEALLVMYVPTELIAGLFGSDNPLLSIPMAAAIGVPMYLNGAGAIPVVGGLLAKGMAPGGAVTFLLGGAVTTVPAMAAVRSIVRRPVFLLYLGVSVIGSILIGFAAQLVL
jgi:uncharacterized protein